MPEGDTVWRAARRLDAALREQELVRCDLRVPRFATVDFTGGVVENVVSRGKHLLIRLRSEGFWTIHSHLKMDGAWHVYAPGEKWRRPAFQARAILATGERTAVGFSLGILQVLPRAAEHNAVGHLGPDLLGPDWDAAEARRRLLSSPDRPIGLALLDQRNLAGLGNIYRCELCFLTGTHPLAPVSAVRDPARMVALAKELLEANKNRGMRTTGAAPDGRRGPSFWVYGRGRKPCLRCGTIIVHEELGDSDLELRDLYYCPHCQPAR